MLINSRTGQYNQKNPLKAERYQYKNSRLGTLLHLYNYFETIFSNIEFLKTLDEARKKIL